MKVQKLARIIFEDDSKMCLVVFISVVSFLAISSVTVYNVLITRELTKDLNELRTQVYIHQEDIRMLKNFISTNNNGYREKRNINSDNITDETISEKASKMPQNITSENLSQDLDYQVSTENTILEETVRSYIEHKHKKHRKHHGKKHHKKHAALSKPENYTFLDQNLNSPSLPTTQEEKISVTQAPVPTLQMLNNSQTSSDIKSFTKRSPDYFESKQEFDPMTDEQVYNPVTRDTRGPYYPTSKNSRRKTSPCIHLSGDATQNRIDRNHDGNGHIRHPNKLFVHWVPSTWHQSSNNFDYSNGHLSIKESGIYFVYAQVYYYEKHEENIFVVQKNHEIFLQCSVHTTSSSNPKGNSCYTAGLEYFKENDKIHVKELLHNRTTVFAPGKSFFGAFKV